MRHLKLPTITDIVRRAHVPYEDVFRFFYQAPLNGDATAQIQRAISEMAHGMNLFEGIHPWSHKTMGVVLPEFIVNDYTGRLLDGMQEALQPLGYDTTYHGIDSIADPNEAQAYFRGLFSAGLAEVGYIITYTALSTQAVVSFCEQYHRPYILMDRDSEEETGQSPAVCLDNRHAILDAMRYLFGLGHRRIGFITGMLPAPSAYFRLMGYKDALAEAGLPFDPELVVAGNWQVNLSMEGTQRLLNLADRPTALIASNDVMAVSAMSAILGAGYAIPKEMSVIGFDDIEMASYTNPSLTTIRQPMFEMGRLAAEMAVDLAAGKTLLEPKHSFRTDLIIRQSTGPI